MNDPGEPVDRGTVQHAVELTLMQVPKTFDVLADDLRERILRGDFPKKTVLPPEPELVTPTRMSRTTVREALRILEVQDLVTTRTGRTGGAVVQTPGGESVANSINLVIHGRQIRISARGTREAMKPPCSELAAWHRTDEDLERLDLTNEAMVAEKDPLEDSLKANIEWQMAVAIAGHNELLSDFMLAISRAIYDATDNRRFIDVNVRRTTVAAQRSITDAIRSQDPEAAARRMKRHVHAYAEAVACVEERTEITVPA